MASNHDMLAITNVPSPLIQECQRTYVEHACIDYETALLQHAAYCQKLTDLGLTTRILRVNQEQPDGVFVEDLAVVLDEVAILCSMGTPSREAEPTAIEHELRRVRELIRVESPAILEGGDVLRVGRTLLVGLSSRTNRAGVEAMAQIAQRHGYRVVAVPIRGCLHLKTACTALPDGQLLVNPSWLDTASLTGFRWLAVPPDEPWGANTLSVGERVLLASCHEKTAGMLRDLRLAEDTVDISEFAKAEGGVSCLSLLFAN